uniref:Uncharacterized protein n=1 Tax=Panagrolaimus sp. PS1159 TaxID=55785 RepID=A0AC35G309_9BILA
MEKNGNGTIVPLENLVKNLVNLKKIFGSNYPFRSCITKNTVEELLEIPHFFQIQKCTLMNIPEVFDIDTFYIYLKKNKI